MQLASEGLKPSRVFLLGADTVSLDVFPVAPDSDITKWLAHLPITKVLCGHDTGSSWRVDEPFKVDLAGAAVLPRPRCWDWARISRVPVVLELDFLDFRSVKYVNAFLLRMGKHQLVHFRPNLSTLMRIEISWNFLDQWLTTFQVAYPGPRLVKSVPIILWATEVDQWAARVPLTAFTKIANEFKTSARL